MSPSETDAARDQSITQVLQARTSAEIAEATETLDRWLQEHPNDTGVADGYEQLSMMQDGTEGQQAQCRPTVVGPQMTALDEARERLCDQVFAANSLAEVTAAQEALRQWMRDLYS